MTVRVLVPGDRALDTGATIELSAEESKYVARVRRRDVGDTVEVLATEAAWTATIVDAGSARSPVVVQLHARREHPPRLAPRTAIFGLVERSATLEAIRSATALDAATVVLTRCARSQSAAPKSPKIKAAIDAARRQCGRIDRPEIIEAANLAAALACAADAPLTFAHPGAARAEDLRPTLGQPGPLRIAVGPEGGFSPAELDDLAAAGGVPFGLGPWILRAEVALTAALSIWAPQRP